MQNPNAGKKHHDKPPSNKELPQLDVLDLLRELDRTGERLQDGLNQWYGWVVGNAQEHIESIRGTLIRCITTIRKTDGELYIDHKGSMAAGTFVDVEGIPSTTELEDLGILDLLVELSRTNDRLQDGLSQWCGWATTRELPKELRAIRQACVRCLTTIRRSDGNLYIDHRESTFGAK